MIASKKNQILIVDRDVAVVDPLRQKLAEAGFMVRAITDASAAVSAISERPPNLLIVDWNIPGFDYIAKPYSIREVVARVICPVASSTTSAQWCGSQHR